MSSIDKALGSYQERYTLAQFARRAKLAEGRARSLYSPEQGKSKLPRPDGFDPDGRPWWFERSIDQWSRETGRALSDDAEWPQAAPTPAEPALVVFAGPVTFTPRHRHKPTRVHVTMWDTSSGHVVLIQRYAEYPMDQWTAFDAALEVVDPAFWQSAHVLIPETVPFPMDWAYPSVDLFRIKVPELSVEEKIARRLPAFLRPALGGDDQRVPPKPGFTESGAPRVKEIARALSQPVPLWLDGSCTVAATQRWPAIGPGKTFTMPDRTTAWPLAERHLTDAVQLQLHSRFPYAFSRLAVKVLSILDKAQGMHTRSALTGEGWYIVTMPALPQLGLELESIARTAAGMEFDFAEATAELAELRAFESDLLWADESGDAVHEAQRQLAAHLVTEVPEAAYAMSMPHLAHVAGPVVEQYLASATVMDERELMQLKRQPTRRLVRLVSEATSHRSEFSDTVESDLAALRAIRVDHVGRWIAEFEESHFVYEQTHVHIEWPLSMPKGWSDATIIAADTADSGVYALTSTPTGELLIDPLPNPGGEPGYQWGYSGTGPSNLHSALLRGASGIWEPSAEAEWLGRTVTSKVLARLGRDSDASPLWSFITEHKGPIRLEWRQVRQWAADELGHAGISA